MRNLTFCAVFALILLSLQQIGRGAVSAYLDVPAIPGSGAPQKYPTSMQILSFSWTPNEKNFEVTRISDANSPIFESYVLSGNPLHNVNVLFYKATNEMHDPYVTYSFGDSFVSAFNFSGGGGQQKENIQFAYETSKVVYLKIPGQNGVASAPGYNNLLTLNSITFDSSGLTINRNLDTASPSLAAAVGSGTDLGTASLLFYDLPIGTNSPVDPPYDVVNLSDLTGTAYQTIAGPAGTIEQMTFAFSDFNDATPEPGSISLSVLGIGGVALRRPARKIR